MRILWVCNIMLPVIAKKLGQIESNKEGWLTGLSGMIMEKKEVSQIELAICFPVEKSLDGIKGEASGLSYFGYYEDTVHEERYNRELEIKLKKIVDEYQPEIIHVFGTEFAHSLAITKAFSHPQRILVGIQGVCYECAKEYMAGLPEKIQNRNLFRDLLKQDNLKKQQEKFNSRGKREIEILQNVGNITGRTDFDRRCTKEVNPDAKYYFLNETLRSNFYEGVWKLQNCNPHTLFICQGNYPLKGLHVVLEALATLKEEFQDIHLCVAGDRITAYGTWKEKLKIGSYGKYLLELIKKYGLQSHVTFEGRLDAMQMKEHYLKCHICVSASYLENSPNSVGEAMLLGVPVISSSVGGVPSMITDCREGLLFEKGNVQQLSSGIRKIFTDDALAQTLSVNARRRAKNTHNPVKNYDNLVEIYKTIAMEQL